MRILKYLNKYKITVVLLGAFIVLINIPIYNAVIFAYAIQSSGI